MKDESMKKNLQRLSDYLDEHDFDQTYLIEVLHEAQNIFGYVPGDAMLLIGEKLNVPVSHIYGVVTFYAHFQLYPAGKYKILLCEGTACHVNGSFNILEELCDLLKIQDGETTEDGLFSLHCVACLGCCSLAPVMQINGRTYGNLTRVSTQQIIESIRNKERLVTA